jgi:3-oxoacyl-[acyl-carrier protein] reductase
MKTKRSMEGKIALITGVSRSIGIGAAICRKIANNGGDIFFAYWRQYDRETHSGNCRNDPANLAAELNQLGVRVESLEIDLSKPDSAERLFQAVEDRLGTPAILVNNACHDFEVQPRRLVLLNYPPCRCQWICRQPARLRFPQRRQI